MRHRENALLQVIPFNILNKKYTVTINALLDCGPDSIIIDNKRATTFRLSEINCKLNLSRAENITFKFYQFSVIFILTPKSNKIIKRKCSESINQSNKEIPTTYPRPSLSTASIERFLNYQS